MRRLRLTAVEKCPLAFQTVGPADGEFDREATSFSAALASAIHDMTIALPGLEIVRVEPDDLVSMAAIAERSGRSRESIRLLAAEQRGPGGFPPPVAYVDQKTRLWHWPDVARWLTEHDKAKLDVREISPSTVRLIGIEETGIRDGRVAPRRGAAGGSDDAVGTARNTKPSASSATVLT